jgi:hypothetical protein
MSAARARPDNRSMPPDAPDRAALLADLRTLAAAPAPGLEHVERALADGYACALQIEAERLRLQHGLEQRARGLSAGRAPEVDAVAGLAEGIARADVELAELRGALAGLASLARRLRAA